MNVQNAQDARAIEIDAGSRPGCGEITLPGVEWIQNGKRHEKGFTSETKRDAFLATLQEGAEPTKQETTGKGSGGPGRPESIPPQADEPEQEVAEDETQG